MNMLEVRFDFFGILGDVFIKVKTCDLRFTFC